MRVSAFRDKYGTTKHFKYTITNSCCSTFLYGYCWLIYLHRPTIFLDARTWRHCHLICQLIALSLPHYSDSAHWNSILVPWEFSVQICTTWDFCDKILGFLKMESGNVGRNAARPIASLTQDLRPIRVKLVRRRTRLLIGAHLVDPNPPHPSTFIFLNPEKGMWTTVSW